MRPTTPKMSARLSIGISPTYKQRNMGEGLGKFQKAGENRRGLARKVEAPDSNATGGV